MQKFRIGTVLTTLALVCMPLTVSAAVFVGGKDYVAGPQDRVADNLYVAGGTVSLGAQMFGDVVVAGGTIIVANSVGGDVLAMGGTVQVLGPVGGDVRVIGGQITISGHVQGDVAVAGGTLHLVPGSIVDGDVSIAGGNVIADGAINGRVRAYAGRLILNGAVAGAVEARISEALVLGSHARLGGALTYRAPQEATIDSAAKIGGVVAYTPNKGMPNNRVPVVAAGVVGVIIAMLTAVKMLAYLGLTVLIVWRWRRGALSVAQEMTERFWASIGWGLVFMICVPIVAILLLVTFVGIIPGILLLMAYAAAMPIATMLAGIFTGSWLAMKFRRRQTMTLTWVSAIGGVILLQLVGLVPVAGTLIHGVLFLAAFGVVALRVQHALAAR